MTEREIEAVERRVARVYREGVITGALLGALLGAFAAVSLLGWPS